jgi:6-pyruvoyltetrahydropterin/6-carboxytetrahydropterin synthase
VRLTRRYSFSAAHRLNSPEFSPEENRRIYGKCNNPYGHGHNYTLHVGVRGPLDRAAGRVVDVRVLDQLVKETVLARYDHKDLNADLPEFASAPPTAENIAMRIREALDASWSGAFAGTKAELDRIRIEETEHNFFELRSL